MASKPALRSAPEENARPLPVIDDGADLVVVGRAPPPPRAGRARTACSRRSSPRGGSGGCAARRRAARSRSSRSPWAAILRAPAACRARARGSCRPRERVRVRLRLAARRRARGVPCRLRGQRRGWGVAMDNRRTLPGYRYFLDPATGERPAVYVAFLDIRPDAGARVDGVVFPARPRRARRARAQLRARARSAGSSTPTSAARCGPTSACPRRASAARPAAARAPRSCGTSTSTRVREGLRRARRAGEFDATTDRPGVPVRALREVRVPPEGGLTPTPDRDSRGLTPTRDGTQGSRPLPRWHSGSDPYPRWHSGV